MKLKIRTQTGQSKKEQELPKQFSEPVNPDLIKRAVLVIQSNKRQRYGSSPEAGKRASSYLSKRRNSYRSTYGIGQSRTPRKVMSRRGQRLNYVGAFAPQTVGGRRAHPPKSEKNLSKKINKKERRKAIRSAMSANLILTYLKEKNYTVPKDYPFILDNSFESLSRTQEVKKVLDKLGISIEIKRKIRAGKGKLRGRKYTRKKGPLFVTSKDCPLSLSSKNMNIESVEVGSLNAELLAPGGQPGRITLFTEGAIDRLKKENLFFDDVTKEVKKIIIKKE
jgi:large subunit ribosomal protein L4e